MWNNDALKIWNDEASIKMVALLAENEKWCVVKLGRVIRFGG